MSWIIQAERTRGRDYGWKTAQGLQVRVRELAGGVVTLTNDLATKAQAQVVRHLEVRGLRAGIVAGHL